MPSPQIIYMPYAIDFEDIENKLFLLQQLCHSGRSYCHDYRINSEPEGREIRGDWIEYSARIKVLVSNYLVECAIKTRIAQDFLSDKNAINTQELDEEITDDSILGIFDDGTELSKIRKSCNKIVHATEAKPEWEIEKGNDGEEFKYWNGTFLLSGEHFGEPWHLSLFIEEWSLNMYFFHSALQSQVDWFSIWDI